MSGTELQDDIFIEPDTEIDLGTQDENESVGDLAPPAPDTEHKKIEFTAEQQELFNREIGKKTFKLREEQRQREELERRIAAYESQSVQQEHAPVVPDVPDQWDENYEQKLRQREEALTKRGEWNARQAFAAKQAHEAEQQRTQLKQQQLASDVEEYKKRAVQSGVSSEELAQAGQAVGAYIYSEDLAQAIIKDDRGALITKYLADNITELEHVSQLSQINPLAAAMYIAENIKPKLSAMKPKTTQAPEPVDVIRGAGATKKDKYHVEGATFE
jgi:hypothetical protein